MLTDAQEIKLKILAGGIAVTEEARRWITRNSKSESLSSADYASTTGMILKIKNDVWVNAPIVDNNANFVANPSVSLRTDGTRLFITEGTTELEAWYCLQPTAQIDPIWQGIPSHVIQTHADRARLSPYSGCSMSCRFCDIPFTTTKEHRGYHPIETCLKAIELANADPIQPAQHLLISGGTPPIPECEHHLEIIKAVLSAHPTMDVDVMMAPIPGMSDYKKLNGFGVNELSINLEIFDSDAAAKYIPHKAEYGIDYYLDSLEAAVAEFGIGRIRSMLLVGLEDLDSTLKGVTAIAQRGAIPVLSAFRPDPSTPLANALPPSYNLIKKAYLESQEICMKHGLSLGPACPPCTHNTISFALDHSAKISYKYAHPKVI